MYELILFLLIVFIFALFSRKLLQKYTRDQMFLVITGIISGKVISTQINLGTQFNFILLIGV